MVSGRIPSEERIFVDSVYLIALFAPDDDWRQVSEMARSELDGPQRFVTSDGVLLEVLAHYSRFSQQLRFELVEYFRRMRVDAAYRVIPHTPELMDAALDLYAGEFAASSFSLQDCVAIAVMREYEITAILTADQEFTRAGFTPLLRRYL